MFEMTAYGYVNQIGLKTFEIVGAIGCARKSLFISYCVRDI